MSSLLVSELAVSVRVVQLSPYFASESGANGYTSGVTDFWTDWLDMDDYQLIERRGLVWPQKRVLVCGPTSFDAPGVDWDLLKAALHKHRPTTIIHGHAAGVDHFASLYSQMFRIDELRFPARWRSYGAKAAVMRNEQMIVHGRPDLVMAFPGGSNCADITQRARRASIPVVVIDQTSEPLTTAQPAATDRIRARG